MEPTRSSLAAQDMRVRTSDPDCGIRVQTTLAAPGTTAGVVSIAEKAEVNPSVSAGKTNASEPLMTCRKRSDVVETGSSCRPGMKLGGCLPIVRLHNWAFCRESKMPWKGCNLRRYG